LDPLAPSASRSAAAAIGLVLVAAFVGAAVRMLPWVLDPTIPWSALAPFARSLGAVAVEAAILVGWPVGWALASQRLVERGEARVLASLGEAPAQTVMRLAPQAAILVAILAATSALLGRDAAAPGRVVGDLLGRGRTSCTKARGPATYGVPFVSATWLCVPGTEPRLVGRAPIGGVVFTATGARVSDDLRRIDLDDARLALGKPAEGPVVHVHVQSLAIRGLAPWARASAIAPSFRALVVTASGAIASCAAVILILLIAARRRIGGVAAAAIGAAGPLAALATLRAIEVRMPDEGAGAGWLVALGLVPIAAFAGAIAASAAAALLAALPERRRTGT
jgi:hypothetical protein